MMSVSLLLVAAVSVLSTSAVVSYAFYQKQQFYPAVVYLTKSNFSLMVIYAQMFVLVLFVGKLARRVFFGQLRPAEVERLMDRSWYAVTETCLAFTMFRDDVSPKFVALFIVLLFFKAFHWLTEDRIDYMERSPVISFGFHLRAVALLMLLSACDMLFIRLAYEHVATHGASVQLVFGFEYAVLLTAIAYTLVKYVLHTADQRRDAPWDNKAVCLLYTELVINFVRMVLYVVFTLLMVRVHTLPLFSIRPLYWALRDLKKALNDVVLSRRAIHVMNTLYPDATAEQLAAGDNVCIICREEMTADSHAKRLPCAHIFHVLCLRSWFQRQQTCPTCRMDILRTPPPPPREPPQAAGAPPPPAPPPGPAARGGVGGGGGMMPAMQDGLAALINQWPFANAAPAQAAPPPVGPSPGRPQRPSATTPSMGPHFPPGFNPPPFALGLGAIPPPPADLAALSDEQLREMEGEQRAAVVARLRHLADIHTLLDAAVALLHDYNRVTPPSSSAATAASASQAASTAATAGDNTGGIHQPLPSSVSDSQADTVVEGALSGVAMAASQVSAPAGNSGCDGRQSGNVSAPLSPQEELRQRRVRRFQSDDDL